MLGVTFYILTGKQMYEEYFWYSSQGFALRKLCDDVSIYVESFPSAIVHSFAMTLRFNSHYK